MRSVVENFTTNARIFWIPDSRNLPTKLFILLRLNSLYLSRPEFLPIDKIRKGKKKEIVLLTILVLELKENREWIESEVILEV